jgi:hypothetical protein
MLDSGKIRINRDLDERREKKKKRERRKEWWTKVKKHDNFCKEE